MILAANIFRTFRVIGEHPWILFAGIGLFIIYRLVMSRIEKSEKEKPSEKEEE